MADDSAARCDAHRAAQQATTVTGERPDTHRGRDPHERPHDDHVHSLSNVTDPSNAAPEATALHNGSYPELWEEADVVRQGSHPAKRDHVAEALDYYARDLPSYRGRHVEPDLTPDQRREAITKWIARWEGKLDGEEVSQLRAALDAPEPTDGDTTEGQPVTDEDALAAALTDDQLAAHTDTPTTTEEAA